MADRYWRGGTGTWNTSSTTNWSTTSGGGGGASVPTAADNVIFDQAATYSVTMTGALTCLSITVSAGTVSFSTGTTPTLAISGSMSLIAMTWTSTGAITFNATTTGQTITTGGTTINASITFNGVGGEWSLGSALTTGVTQTTTLTNGSLVLNGYDLTTGIFSSTNANTRSIAFGANNIILAHTTAAQTVLSMAIATGFTYTSSGTFGSGTGTFQATMSTTRTFVFGTTNGSTTNAPTLELVSGASVATITTGSWFNELNFGSTAFTIAATSLNLNSLQTPNSTSVLTNLTATMRGTGSIYLNGANSIGPLVINSTSGTTTVQGGSTLLCTTCTLTSGTLDLSTSATLTCSSTFTWTSGSLINIGALNCTTFTLNGPTFNFTGGNIYPSVSFVVTSGSFTLNGGGLGAVPTFTHTAGTVRITANQTVSLAATGTYTFTSGSLILENNGLAAQLNVGIFSSSGTGVRSITFGNTQSGGYPPFINLTHTTAATTVLSMATVTNFTWTAAYDVAIGYGWAGFKSVMPATQTFVFGTTGGSVTNSPNLKIEGSSTPTITTASWFNVLDFSSAQSFTLPATSLNLNSIVPNWAYATISLANLTSTMRGTGFLQGGPSVGAVVINNPGYVTQIVSNFFAPVYSLSPLTCTTLTITAGTLDGGVQTFTGSCTAGVLTTTGSPTLVPGCTIYDGDTVSSGPIGYVGTILSGSGNSWLLTTPSTSFASKNLATNGSQTYSPPAGITCSAGVTWTGGSLTNFGKTDALTAGGSSSLVLACTTFTVNGPTFNHTLQNGGTINPSTSFVLTSGSYTYNDGVLGAVPTFTQTSGPVTFNYNYSLTTTGTYTLTAGTLTLADGVTLNTGIFSSTGAGTRAIGFGASIVSGSVAFNGTNQYLTAPSISAYEFGTGDFTVEGWYYFNSFGTDNALMLLGTGATVSSNLSAWWMRYYSPSQSLSWYRYDGINPEVNYMFPLTSALTTGKWYHIACTRSGTNLQFFLNGIPVSGSQTCSTNYTVVNSDPLNIGFCGTGNGIFYLDGRVSNTRAVKGVAVYTSAFTPSTTPLTPTQSANINGSPSSAITGTQTSLLLNTVYGTNFLADSSTYNATITNNGTATKFLYSPFVGVVNLTHTTAATVVLNMAALGGFTYTGSGGFTVADMSNTRTLSVGNTSGGSLTTAPNLNFTSGASIATMSTGGWFNNLDFGTTSFTIAATALNITGDLTLSSSGTYTSLTATLRDTGTATLTTNGKTIAALTVNGPAGVFTFADALTITGALTLTAGAISSQYNLTSASFASAGPYSRSIVGPNSTYTISGAGATAWNFSSTGSVLLNGTTQNLSEANNAAFTFGAAPFTVECWFYQTAFGATNQALISLYKLSTGRAWIFYTTTGGAVAATTNTGGLSGGTVSLNTWNHVAWVSDGTDFYLYLNGTHVATAAVTPIIASTDPLFIGANNDAASPTWRFSGYITNVRLVKGVAVYTGNFTTPTAPLLPTQSAGTNISAITGTQTSLLLSTPSTSFLTDYSNNNFTVTNTGTATANILSPFAVTSPGITFTGFTINMTNAAAKTFAGGGATYPVLNQAALGALTISGSNTFDTISNSVEPTTFTFTIATTQTVNNFAVAGIPGSLVTINSSTATTAATLSKASGTVYGSYLSIRDSTATGGATWYAGPTSTNTSNNTGWIFTRLPIVTFGNLTVADGGFTVSDSPMVF